MFTVNADTKVIDMHQGDTGAITFTISGYDWSSVTAKAIFTARKKNSDETIKEVTSGNLGSNGQFVVSFVNSDTDTLTPGNYEYDVVLIVTPVVTNGTITDGSVVRTLVDPTPLIIRRRVNNV